MKREKNQGAFTLRRRFWIEIAATILAALIFTALQLRYMDDIFVFSAKESMISAGDTALSIDYGTDDYLRKMSELETKLTVYVEIYQNKENLIYTSNANSWVYDASTGAQTVLRPRIMKINSHEDNEDGSYFEIRQEYFSSAKYIVYEQSEGSLTAVVFYSLDTVYDNSATAKVIALGVSVIFMAVMIFIISFYNRRIIGPLEQINAVTKEIAALNFENKLPPFRIRDLNELGASVNSLSDSLSESLHRLEKTNEQLKNDFLRKAEEEESRKQFIANASHELKTPIAIIQSYAEGIKFDDSGELTSEYSDVILDESEKMNSLIMRLLNIAKMDSDKYKLETEEFLADEWVLNAVRPFVRLAECSGIELTAEASSNATVSAGKELMRQIISNYISNAISHCEGEKKIEVKCEIIDGKARVSVFNTGQHIANEDMPNIWHSFYRADKAHSRAQGRFGLGLSIVKSIQELHGEGYGAVNVNGGVRFWFDMKITKVK